MKFFHELISYPIFPGNQRLIEQAYYAILFPSPTYGKEPTGEKKEKKNTFVRPLIYYVWIRGLHTAW